MISESWLLIITFSPASCYLQRHKPTSRDREYDVGVSRSLFTQSGVPKTLVSTLRARRGDRAIIDAEAKMTRAQNVRTRVPQWDLKANKLTPRMLTNLRTYRAL